MKNAKIIFITLSLTTLLSNSSLKIIEDNNSKNEIVIEKIRTNKLREKKDIECLAKNIYHEARGSSISDMKAVGMVVINRVKHHRWPDSICRVVYQTQKLSNGKTVAQFSWLTEHKNHKIDDIKSYIKIYKLSKQLYQKSKTKQWRKFDITKGADHYYQPNLISRPKWANSKYVMNETKIGSHIYLKLKY